MDAIEDECQAAERAAALSVGRLRETYRRSFGMTLAEWLMRHQRNIVFNDCSWMGVPTIKNPLDCWIYQEIVHEVEPDVIIEIGSAYGGSTLYLAHLLDAIGQGRVVSIDKDREHYRVRHNRIVVVTGDSSSQDVLRHVSQLCQGQSVLVIHDADHRKEQVIADLRAYAPLVTVNSYFIVEDGIIDLFDPGEGIGTIESGPLAAIQIFLQENASFIVDEEWERYIITYNPKGFLKRVR
jgi:cephalosporin hydroxylase